MQSSADKAPSLAQHHAASTRLHLAALCGAYLLLNTVVAGTAGFLLALFFLLVGAAGYRLLPARAVMRMRRAMPPPPSVCWRLQPIIEQLSRRAGLRRPPELWLLRTPEVNAFTLEGSDRSAIAVSEGTLRFCGVEEIAAVIAHELAHLRNRDQYLMHVALFVHTATSALGVLLVLTAVVSAPLALLGAAELPGLQILAAAVGIPAISALLVLSLSRTREFAADLDAARLTGSVEPMAAALRRIARVQSLLERFGHRRLALPEALSTHPDLRSRLAHLQQARAEYDRGRLPTWRTIRLE